MDSVQTRPFDAIRYKLLLSGVDPDSVVAQGATAFDRALDESLDDPRVDRYNEIVQNSTLSEAALLSDSKIDDIKQQAGSLLKQIQDSQSQLQQIADAPQLLPVPGDASLNLIGRLGAALHNIGGNTGQVQKLFGEKKGMVDKQRASVLEALRIQNQIETQFKSSLISKLSNDIDRLSGLGAAKSKMLDADGLVGQEREDAQFGVDLGLLSSGAITSDELWSSGANRAAAMRAGISLDEILSLEGEAKAEPDSLPETSALTDTETDALALADELGSFIFGA